MAIVTLRTGQLGDDGDVLCVCDHARNTWHDCNDSGQGVGSCRAAAAFRTGAFPSNDVNRPRPCVCQQYRPGGGIAIWPPQTFQYRSLQHQRDLWEAERVGHIGRSHHDPGRAVDV